MKIVFCYFYSAYPAAPRLLFAVYPAGYGTKITVHTLIVTYKIPLVNPNKLFDIGKI